MVQIEFLKQLWRNCLRQSRLEEVLHTANGKSQAIEIATIANQLPSQKVDSCENDLLSSNFEKKLEASLIKWAQARNDFASKIDEGQFYQQIYAMFGNII